MASLFQAVDWTAVAAVAAVLGVFVAAVTFQLQFRITRSASSAENLWRLNDEWLSPSMASTRAIAAKALLNGVQNAEISTVCSFFEFLGLMVRRRAIEADTAWSMFSDWALPYWFACRPFIQADQTTDSTFWTEFAYLSDVMLRIEARKRHLTVHNVLVPESSVHNFLAGEAQQIAEVRMQVVGWRRSSRT